MTLLVLWVFAMIIIFTHWEMCWFAIPPSQNSLLWPYRSKIHILLSESSNIYKNCYKASVFLFCFLLWTYSNGLLVLSCSLKWQTLSAWIQATSLAVPQHQSLTCSYNTCNPGKTSNLVARALLTHNDTNKSRNHPLWNKNSPLLSPGNFPSSWPLC